MKPDPHTLRKSHTLRKLATTALSLVSLTGGTQASILTLDPLVNGDFEQSDVTGEEAELAGWVFNSRNVRDRRDQRFADMGEHRRSRQPGCHGIRDRR